MKFSILAWIFAFCGACASPPDKNNNHQATITENKKEYSFEFDKEIHNFGLLHAGEVVIYNFIFVNTGTRELEFSLQKTDCPCLEVSAANKNVKSGEKGTIKVTFNTAGLHGQQLQMIRITAGDDKLTKDLAITAEVKNENIIFK